MPNHYFIAKTKQVKQFTKTRLPLPNRGPTASAAAQKPRTSGLPKRQQKRRYTISTPIPAASSSLFSSCGFKRSEMDGNPSFVATAREAFEKLAERNSHLSKPRPRLLRTSSSSSELDTLKQHEKGFDQSHSLLQNSSREMHGSDRLSSLPLVSTSNQSVESDRTHVEVRREVSCIQVSPLNKKLWKGSNELGHTGMHGMSAVPEREDCDSMSKASKPISQTLHSVVSLATGHHGSGSFDCLHGELLGDDYGTPSAVRPPQVAKVNMHYSKQQDGHKTLIPSMAMPVSHVLIDSSGSGQSVESVVSVDSRVDSRKGDAYFRRSSSVDTVIAAQSTRSSVVSVDDIAVQQLQFCTSSTRERWAAAEPDDVKPERDVSSVACSREGGLLQPVNTSRDSSHGETVASESDRLPVKFVSPVSTGQTDQLSNHDCDNLSVVSATSLQKQDGRGSEQAGYYADRELSSDHDIDSASSSEIPTDAAVDDTKTNLNPPVEQKIRKRLNGTRVASQLLGSIVGVTRAVASDFICIGRQLSDRKMKSCQFGGKATVGRIEIFNSGKLGSPSSQLSSSERTIVEEIDGGKLNVTAVSSVVMGMGCVCGCVVCVDESVRLGREQTLAQTKITVCCGIGCCEH